MNSCRRELRIGAQTRRAHLNITPQAEAALPAVRVAHLKRLAMGREVVVAVTNGKLDLGTREQVSCGEFDRKRGKRVSIKFIGESCAPRILPHGTQVRFPHTKPWQDQARPHAETCTIRLHDLRGAGRP